MGGKTNGILAYLALPRVAKILDIWACSDHRLSSDYKLRFDKKKKLSWTFRDFFV